ncbi:MAG: Electron transport complex protein RnfA [Tenericutes bacterium ADurb.Bin239]|jgi:electron transport complex protein RnfA|nr:MAG: Electron transport complex protein RnfA [Tenericutes bacterium ADurb.Bin239]
MQFILMGIGAVLINNIILTRFLGICPLLGVSKSNSSAVGMSLAVVFVVTMSAILSYSLYMFVLVPLKIEYLRLVSFILIIASFVQFVEMFLKRFVPALYKSLGIYLPLITTNCVVLAVSLDVVAMSGGVAVYNFLNMVGYAFFTAVGYAFILILFSFIQERLINNKYIPNSFKGSGIALVTIGLLVMAFLGFSGMI